MDIDQPEPSSTDGIQSHVDFNEKEDGRSPNGNLLLLSQACDKYSCDRGGVACDVPCSNPKKVVFNLKEPTNDKPHLNGLQKGKDVRKPAPGAIVKRNVRKKNNADVLRALVAERKARRSTRNK